MRLIGGNGNNRAAAPAPWASSSVVDVFGTCSYPEVFGAILQGTLARDIAAHSARVLHNDLQGFELDEAAVLALLRARAALWRAG